MSIEYTQELSEALTGRYLPTNIDEARVAEGREKLTSSITPTEIFACAAEGAEIETNVGRIIDMSSMTVNTVLGQNDWWVTANMIAMLKSGRPSFLSTRYGSEFYYYVAAELAKVGGIPDAVVNHRQCNGSDVTELAVLAASQRRRGRSTLVSLEGSYHGQNLTAYLSSHKQMQHRFLANGNNVEFLPPPANVGVDYNELCIEDLEILDYLRENRNEVFAVILEPIQANNAMLTPGRPFMRELVNVCNEADIAVIFDEVQTSFGWLGEMSAAERYAVQPDILAVSKGLTGGYGPMAAVVLNKKYEQLPYGTAEKTNGADIRSLVAAKAVMERLHGLDEEQIPSCLPDDLATELQRGLLVDVPERANSLQERLREVQADTKGIITSLSGDRLMRGLQIVDAKGHPAPDLAKRIYQDLLKRNVYIRCSGSTLIVKPPLVITDTQIERGLDVLRSTLLDHCV